MQRERPRHEVERGRLERLLNMRLGKHHIVPGEQFQILFGIVGEGREWNRFDCRLADVLFQ